jgi:hypothetical protein
MGILSQKVIRFECICSQFSQFQPKFSQIPCDIHKLAQENAHGGKRWLGLINKGTDMVAYPE